MARVTRCGTAEGGCGVGPCARALFADARRYRASNRLRSAHSSRELFSDGCQSRVPECEVRTFARSLEFLTNVVLGCLVGEVDEGGMQ
jgi:hypothetical protein